MNNYESETMIYMKEWYIYILISEIEHWTEEMNISIKRK